MSILRKILAILADFIESFVIAGALFAVIYYFLFRPFIVVGHSMDPTYADGENVITNLITLRIAPLKRGDVIVFQAPPPNQEKDYIKRVIGIPGDTVMVKDGKVYVNDKMLDESSYLASDLQTAAGAFMNEGKEVTVPDNNYIVFGDNRNNSSDSREWGFVPKDKIIGKSFIVYWPLTKMRGFKDPMYNAIP